MSIHKVYKDFEYTGRFILSNTKLDRKSLSNIRNEIKTIRDNFKKKPTVDSQPVYQLQLKAVSFSIKNVLPPILEDAIMLEQDSCSSIPPSPVPDMEQQEEFETVLLEILGLDWQVIRLDQLSFLREGREDHPLSSSFYERLFTQLTTQHRTLHELSLELNRANIILLHNFISHATALKTLRLDMNSFIESVATDNIYFHILALTLTRCSQLQVLEFQNPPQIDAFYKALNQLLDGRSQLEHMIIPEPKLGIPQSLKWQNMEQYQFVQREYFKLQGRLTEREQRSKELQRLKSQDPLKTELQEMGKELNKEREKNCVQDNAIVQLNAEIQTVREEFKRQISKLSSIVNGLLCQITQLSTSESDKRTMTPVELAVVVEESEAVNIEASNRFFYKPRL